MPFIHTIDMKAEPKHEFNSIFSKKLVDEINKALDLGKQVILLEIGEVIPLNGNVVLVVIILCVIIVMSL